MISSAIKRMNLTEGERSLLLAYGVVSLFGAGISFTIVNQLEGNAGMLRVLSFYDIWMIFAGMFGACSGLYFARGWMGHAGSRGLLDMLKAIGLTSFAAAIVGGTLALPFYGTMFGPFLLGLTFWGHPLLALFWVATLVGVHVLFRFWREERDSIFRKLEDDGIPA